MQLEPSGMAFGKLQSVSRSVCPRAAPLHHELVGQDLNPAMRPLPNPQKEVKEWMKFFDTNKDGKVHVDEYFSLPKSHQSYWDKVDINNDE